MKLNIKREGEILNSVEIDDNTIYNSEFMGMDKISASFYTESPLDLKLDDYVDYNLQKYSIKTAIDCEQIDSKTFKYDITFFAPVYSMYDVLLMHLGNATFSYTATPFEVLSLVIENLNTEQTGWEIGDCSLISEPITFSFAEQSCRVALTNIADAFKLEYKVIGKKIFLLEKLGELKDIQLKYGRGQGLTKATRQSVDQSFATVWFGFGGSTNLPDNYRSGATKLTLSAPFEINTDKYGRKQGSVTFEDIYPRRTSTLTAVNGLQEMTDSTIDFDLNAQQITDGGAKIVFKSGELSGQEFVITSYNNTTKAITIGTNKDETGYTQPNTTFAPAVGDKYTLIGLIMPNSYVIAAETELEAALQAHAKNNSFPPVAFPLNVDEKYIREMNLNFKLVAGDSLRVLSESLGINTPLRLQSVSWPLVNPSLISGLVSDVIQYTTAERIIKAVVANIKETAKSIATGLYAKQVGDEINNAAIMQQFKRTFVGDRAILTGAFVAGNPEAGEVAGINGTGTTTDEVRFWAGSSFENKETAPFRVQQDGKMFATDAIIEGIITALSGKIGFLDVDNSVLSLGAVPGSSDPWASNSSAIRLYRDSFIYRLNGMTRGEIRELAYNIYSNPLGSYTTESARITNNITNNETGEGVNVGLTLDVANADTNIALKVNAGKVLLKADANIQVDDSGTLKDGLTYGVDVRVGGDQFVRMRWVKGVMVSAVAL
ncbi:hypothetical protein ACVWYG_000728 [Pedobacter sp. UYEF25]